MVAFSSPVLGQTPLTLSNSHEVSSTGGVASMSEANNKDLAQHRGL